MTRRARVTTPTARRTRRPRKHTSRPPTGRPSRAASDEDEDDLPLRPSQYSRPPAPGLTFGDQPLAEMAAAMERAAREEDLPPTRPATPAAGVSAVAAPGAGGAPPSPASGAPSAIGPVETSPAEDPSAEDPPAEAAPTAASPSEVAPTARLESVGAADTAARLDAGGPAVRAANLDAFEGSDDDAFGEEDDDGAHRAAEDAHDDEDAYDDEEDEGAYDDEEEEDEDAYDDEEGEGAYDDEEGEERSARQDELSLLAGVEDDPNATTLVSAKGPRIASPASQVSIVEADDDPASESFLDAHPAVDFLNERDEPSASEAPRRRARHEEASLMPVVDDLAGDDEPFELPGVAARRARLRRVVGGVVGLVAVAALGLGIKAAVGGAEAPVAAAPPAVAPPAPEAAALAKPATETEPAGHAAASVPNGGDSEEAPSEGDGSLEEARTSTVSLLKEGKSEEAERWARKVIELSPDDAFGYRALGAALQDQGKLREAREAFSDCVTLAKTGDIGECNALGGVLKKR